MEANSGIHFLPRRLEEDDSIPLRYRGILGSPSAVLVAPRTTSRAPSAKTTRERVQYFQCVATNETENRSENFSSDQNSRRSAANGGRLSVFRKHKSPCSKAFTKSTIHFRFITVQEQLCTSGNLISVVRVTKSIGERTERIFLLTMNIFNKRRFGFKNSYRANIRSKRGSYYCSILDIEFEI